jgi:hypothetical protein
MNSIAAFQMVQALDEERLRRAEKRRLARQVPTPATASDARIASGNWRAILRFPRFSTAASKS